VFSLLHYIFKAFASHDPHFIQSSMCVVTWIWPNFGLVSLNVDNNMFLESNLDAFGGLICDCTRSFLHEFLGNISRPCILHAEILGLYHGLKLCWNSDYKHVLCLSDSRIVVDLVQKGLNMFHKYENFIWTINWYRMLRYWVVNLQHTMRKGNVAPNFLTKKGAWVTVTMLSSMKPLLTCHLYS